jgi:hypothetical protein
MSAFPHFSNIKGYIQKKLSQRKGSTYNVSKLNTWVRITSGTGPNGMVLVSNPNFNLFKAAGSNSTGIYGNSKLAGTIGTDWSGNPINSGEGQGYRPAPIVSSLEIDEGAGNLSRKASFSITAHSKEQMQTLSKYFMEPGYSIFIEWGWNTKDGVSGLQTLSAENISNFQSFVKTDEVRETAKGEYDNYLGFMTGGGITLDGDKWTLNVNCTGYTELPSYLLTTETGEAKSGEADEKLTSAESYGSLTVKTTGGGGLGDVAKQRWMRVFNELPDTRRTKRIKGLENELSKLENFIGFDDEVSEDLNSTTDGASFLGFKLWKETKKVDGENVTFPEGTKIVSDKKFIKFSALMRIISEIGVEGYYLNNDESKMIKFSINSSDTKCSAFKNIYSVDPDKLFIPNPETPKFKLGSVSADSKISDLITAEKPINNSVRKSRKDDSAGVVKFPIETPLSKSEKLAETITKEGFRYGMLDDLYVNFEFAKSVLSTKNFFIKDALYQILNGMSSAVNGMWDFQITENESSRKTDGNQTIVSTELKIHEMNFSSNNIGTPPYTFSLIGTNSIFIDSSFDLDISGAKMNQIIGQKLGQALNGDTKELPKKLFATEEDILGIKIKEKKPTGTPTGNTTKDEEQLKEDNLNILLGKLFFYPRVELTDFTSTKGELYDLVYIGAFRDSNIFSSLKRGDSVNHPNDVSPLMPINFSFSIHGISGIKRGDKFVVDGIPEKYKNGFFQVLSVKHTLDGMLWKTEVTGGFRRNNN